MSTEDTFGHETQPPRSNIKVAFILGVLAGFLLFYWWGTLLTYLGQIPQFYHTVVMDAIVAGLIIICSLKQWAAGRWFFVAILVTFLSNSILAESVLLLATTQDYGAI